MVRQKYGFKDSPFFRLQSKRKLAKLLRVSLSNLTRLSQLEDGYVHFEKLKKNGEPRIISAPILPLKSVQSRIADLLGRIATPDYLYAPVKGRSYVNNAARHVGVRSLHLLDIEDFFPNCTIYKVIEFFQTRMECSPDVTVILAHIVTHDDALPQGSPCSPILAFFTYFDMWEEMSKSVEGAGCTLSVYADDVTISGDTVPKAIIWNVKQIIYKHGHRYAAHKERSRRDRPAEVTGAIVKLDEVTVPNRQRKKLLEVENELKRPKSPEHAKHLEAQLRGRLAQVKQVKNGNHGEIG